MIPSHHTLDAIDGTNHMRFIDHIRTANPNKQIFGVVRHPDNLMRNHLPNGEYQIIRGIQNHLIDFHINGFTPNSFRNLLEIITRHLSELATSVRQLCTKKRS